MKNFPKLATSLVEYKFIDLFSGIGGFHQALASFGAKCIFASDINLQACVTYEMNHGLKPNGDITNIDAKDIPEHDILTAGFPCQSFSIAGKKAGFDEIRGTLFFDVARIMKHHKPKVAILENVKNFASHDEGKTLKIILSTLDDIGYTTVHKVLNSAYFGAPQARERIYIIAIRKDLELTNFVIPEFAKDINGKQVASMTVEDILCATPEEIEKLKVKVPLHTLQIRDLSGLPERTFKPVRVGEIDNNGKSQGYRLYSPKSVGNTLTTSGGGIGSNKGGPYYFEKENYARKLSKKECLALMGFPSTFKPHVKDNESYKQSGNSVVVDVIQEIVKELILQKII
jgi:DNA (cytosine-5)-methyltransferase 1